jgi:hypothetical protein
MPNIAKVINGEIAVIEKPFAHVSGLHVDDRFIACQVSEGQPEQRQMSSGLSFSIKLRFSRQLRLTRTELGSGRNQGKDSISEICRYDSEIAWGK